MIERNIPGRETLNFILKEEEGSKIITDSIVQQPFDWDEIFPTFQALPPKRRLFLSQEQNSPHLAAEVLRHHTSTMLDRTLDLHFVRYPVVSPTNPFVRSAGYRFTKKGLEEPSTEHIVISKIGAGKDVYCELDEMFLYGDTLTVLELKIITPNKRVALGSVVNNHILNHIMTPLQSFAKEHPKLGIKGYNFVVLTLPDVSRAHADSVIEFQQQGGLVKSFEQISYRTYMDNIHQLQSRLQTG